MPIYSPGRRRAILLLLLTSVLLLTLDLRGSQIIDAARRGFDKVQEPFRNAAEVVSRPIENAWRGITDYEALAERNRQLQEEIDAARADTVSARAVIIEDQQLRALNDLESLGDYPTLIATVVGQGPTNIDQVIEINRGSEDGIEVGMPVISTAGLVGRVTAPVEPNRARIMLILDSRYAVDVKIVPQAPPTTTTTTTLPPEAMTTTTISAGPLPGDSTVPPPTTQPGDSTPPVTSAPPAAPGATTSSTLATDTSVPSSAPSSTVPVETLPATTTTIDVDLVRETGGLTGQGDGELPSVRFLDNAPTLGRHQVGDLVFTSGSQSSNAPANIPIGRVVEVIEGSAAAGPTLRVEPFAHLDRLYFVKVIIYRPNITGASDENGD